MLEQHPLWDCFVTPGVALTARQNQGSDPVSEFEKWVHVFPLRSSFNKEYRQGDVNTPRSLVQDWTRTAIFVINGTAAQKRVHS
jgi:hypothetical protein